MSFAGSSSSGVKTSSQVIHVGKSKLISCYLTSTANAVCTLKLWDSANSTTTGKKEILRLQIHAGGNAESIEHDLHGMISNNGIYAQISGTGAYTVAFA